MAKVAFNGMAYLWLIFLLNFQFFVSETQSEDTSRPEVVISLGTLQGRTLITSHGRNISAYIGIPYAQPPIGNLRFADPVAAGGWNEPRDASMDASMCPQISDNVTIGDEDCLYLNVYTPLLSQNTNSSLIPVMVYIHGGGFIEGSGAYSKLGPDYILNEDVVLVTLNYRLGALGFLSTGDNVATGNWGLKDQVLALQWVQDNIEVFGGDPDSVTLFGVSAGAGAVDLLAMSNATNGLFDRCITQSGSALASITYRSSRDYASTAFELGEFLSCSNGTSDSLISCLRTVELWELIASAVSLTWGPTDEPDILTDSPANLIAAEKIRDIPQISGVTKDEGLSSTTAYYEDEELFLNFLETIDSSLISILSYTNQPERAAWVDEIMAYYLNDLTADTSLLLSNLTTLLSDKTFYYPAYKAMKQRLAIGVQPQYFYTFNYEGIFSNGSFGVAHAVDLNYLFVRDSVSSDLIEAMTEADYEMVNTTVQLWTSFAINGIPTASALNGTTWDPYSDTENYYLRIGNESDPTPTVEYFPFEARMQFWADLEASLQDTTASATEAGDSGVVTLSPNLLFVLLLACSKFIFSAVIVDRLETVYVFW